MPDRVAAIELKPTAFIVGELLAELLQANVELELIALRRVELDNPETIQSKVEGRSKQLEKRIAREHPAMAVYLLAV